MRKPFEYGIKLSCITASTRSGMCFVVIFFRKKWPFKIRTALNHIFVNYLSDADLIIVYRARTGNEPLQPPPIPPPPLLLPSGSDSSGGSSGSSDSGSSGSDSDSDNEFGKRKKRRKRRSKRRSKRRKRRSKRRSKSKRKT